MAPGRTPEMPNMGIVTAIPADPCQFPTADLINKLSVVNKQDYARLHGFELHVSSDIIDPNITAVRAAFLSSVLAAASSRMGALACIRHVKSANPIASTPVEMQKRPNASLLRESGISAA